MADLPIRTQDVSIRDEVSGYSAGVNSDNEQLVHDAEGNDWLETIANATGGTEDKIATSWQFFCVNNLAFSSPYEVTLGTGAETDIYLLKNPIGSGLDLRIKYISFGIKTASTAMSFRTYKTPTVTTDGTPLVEVNYHDDAVTGLGETYGQPTISARGDIFKQLDLNSGGTGTLGADEDLAIFIEPGEFFLVTADATAANKSISMGLSWAEDDSLHV